MRVLVLFAVAFGIGTNIPALRASEHVLLDKKGVQVKLRIQGIAGYEGERWRSDKNFERSFSVQNESNEEVINLSVIVVDIQPHDSQPTSAVNPINHSWKLGTCWSIHCWGTEQTGYSASHSSNASARWEHNKTVIRLGVVLETRCPLGSGALLKARRKIPIEVETISESDLRAAQSWVNDACNNLSNSVVGNERERYSLLNGLETTLGMPEVVAGLSENQRDYLLKLRLAPNTRSFPRVANQISLSISKQGLSKQPILDRYSRMLLESPKYAVSDLMELDSWDRSLEEPLMMVFEDDPNPDMLNAIGMLVRRHNILVNRRRLTAALRRHGHLADSPKERPPSPVRVRTKINTFREFHLFSPTQDGVKCG